jgi:hypothetical protein
MARVKQSVLLDLHRVATSISHLAKSMGVADRSFFVISFVWPLFDEGDDDTTYWIASKRIGIKGSSLREQPTMYNSVRLRALCPHQN